MAVERDAHNFSSSSSHRMPTISASQALADLDAPSTRRFVRTGLRRLDTILCAATHTSSEDVSSGGFPRGQISEIYGPPGVGKTAFAMQASANALLEGEHVVWGYNLRGHTDCASPIVGARFTEILCNAKLRKVNQVPLSSPPQPTTVEGLLDGFCHYSAPTLPHLIALLVQHAPSFLTPKTGLLVIDSISTLFTIAFPRISDNKQLARLRTSQDGGEQSARGSFHVKQHDVARKWASSRRWAVMSDLMSKLTRVAALSNLVVILTSQTTTRVTTSIGAVLSPPLSSTAWDAGLANRIVLFRDNYSVQDHDQTPNTNDVEEVSKSSAKIRFAGVLKAGEIFHRKSCTGQVIPFFISESGLCEAESIMQPVKTLVSLPIKRSPKKPELKRKRGEVANSESSDSSDPEIDDLNAAEVDNYAWADDDVAESGNAEGCLATESTSDPVKSIDFSGTDGFSKMPGLPPAALPVAIAHQLVPEGTHD